MLKVYILLNLIKFILNKTIDFDSYTDKKFKVVNNINIQF